MDGSIQLTKSERNACLKLVRAGKGRSGRRAHILLLLSEGHSWRFIRDVMYASNDLIASVVRDYRERQTLAGDDNSRESTLLSQWTGHLKKWLETSPREFGYFRTRWSCEMLAEVLAWEKGIRRSGETVRKHLHQIGFAWRRPRPTLEKVDPDYRTKLSKIQRLLRTMPANHTAVFQDEVDINLNPKIGSCWMKVGQQALVTTPGNNVKRYLAGSIHWRTGRVLISEAGRRRNSELFIDHLTDLRTRLRRYETIHVICDNAAFHGSRVVMEYLYHYQDRLEIHFLPAYAPETNPIERVWWHLHEVITRNHKYNNIDELVEAANEWFQQQAYFGIETSLYATAA